VDTGQCHQVKRNFFFLPSFRQAGKRVKKSLLKTFAAEYGGIKDFREENA
jgi:hypothetical protein